VNTATEPSQKDNYTFTTSDLAGIAKQLNVPIKHCGAIVDSGVTSHFCPDRGKFLNYVTIEPQPIHTADGTTINTIGKGDVRLDLPLGNKQTTVTLKNALYVPKMAFTLISTNQIAAAGLAIHFEDKMCKILSPGPKQTVIAEIPQVDDLYSVVAHSQHHANMARGKLTICQLHRALGHVS
jgi:hypothetical protein